jgi:hypothetical protein
VHSVGICGGRSAQYGSLHGCLFRPLLAGAPQITLIYVVLCYAVLYYCWCVVLCCVVLCYLSFAYTELCSIVPFLVTYSTRCWLVRLPITPIYAMLCCTDVHPMSVVLCFAFFCALLCPHLGCLLHPLLAGSYSVYFPFMCCIFSLTVSCIFYACAVYHLCLHFLVK